MSVRSKPCVQDSKRRVVEDDCVVDMIEEPDSQSMSIASEHADQTTKVVFRRCLMLLCW